MIDVHFDSFYVPYAYETEYVSYENKLAHAMPWCEKCKVSKCLLIGYTENSWICIHCKE